ncbi:AmmeMemoRadiSam system protein A [Alisedimentitalea sp. MJ-SS2]|uniref:AmmeMemoRadiSam system protein A n=1 Tax=Aliisedimentitalea sp. MJ-SS2 TaxID=3049795 RepID=UPI0029078D95|nr:AmmeMemoRadiSam system protein A [Alisedimentitalea sp. MJ-SS2]MDU8926057.1 AmmeMemoRadiSam system protein A [Alisedimentitalea sp. MJ-SS2]
MTAEVAANLRKSTVAGRFFPADPEALKAEVMRCLREAGRVFSPVPSQPRAVISPHAGYVFSGVLTAAALQMGKGWNVTRIVVLSPAHRHAFDGIALPSQDGYELPGLNLPIDGAGRDVLLKAGLARVLDAAHEAEHGIETQLPFIAALYRDVPVLPLVVGQAGTKIVAQVIDALTEPKTLFVLSSDLSHFLNQAEAVKQDAVTARKIETGDFASLDGSDACGARGIAGFLASGAGGGTRALRLGMTSSYAATGESSRVVGYGAWSLHRPEDDILDAARRQELLRVAREVLEHRIHRGKPPDLKLESFSPRLQSYAASFVTLEVEGQLRGCIGSLAPHLPLVRDVADNVVKAAFKDPRFKPITEEELENIRIKISVLSRPAPVTFDSEENALSLLIPHETGALLRDGAHRGVFLPQVWDSLPTPEAFLNGLKRKAGLPEDHWSDTLRIETFRGEVFGETE